MSRRSQRLVMHLRLMAVVAQAGDLAQPQLAVEETHRLFMQLIVHPAPIELGAPAHEAPLVDTRGSCLCDR